GGVYSRTDLALDPAAYCAALVSGAQNFGTTFMFGEAVTGFAVTGGQVTGVRTANGCLPFDRVIVCAGNGTPELLVPLGVPVPVYPVRGYSFTLPSGEKALSVSVTSLRHKIVYADLGDTVRVAGFFDINRATSTIASRLRELLNLARRIWPDAADYDHPCSEWTGCRPMTPSGVPVTGESPVKNLYINAGHGSLGYTFAAGSAA
ncbi:MAG: FAD-dependent oxidoreductase, partial [Hyphomonadaceae bacterium]|nr:FAD-dependent oxidoreductase [Hyphomonadaceae bacterium]